ncbi:hypothetical protein [Natronospira sp.]|uniref:hypothetical protein n=1 Tax=Natronospira sp. TaxID=2024970 RepID=UPI003873B227
MNRQRLLVPIAWLARLLAATAVTAALGSLVQTQFNMNAIAALGAPVDMWTRVVVSVQDLTGFAPLWGVLVGISLLLAFAVAAGISRLKPDVAGWLYPIGGLAALLTLLGLLHGLLPMTPIAATRSLSGTLLMALPGLVGGWLFLYLKQPSAEQVQSTSS